MIYVVFAAKGGVGATTLACDLVARLATVDGGAVLVDLDLMNGDLYGALDLPATTTLADVLDDIDGLEGEALRRRLPLHASGFHVLSQANRLEQLEQVSWPAVAELLARLGRHFGAVVVDGVRDFSDVALTAVDAADVVAVVTTPELMAVRAARRARVVLRHLGVGDDKLALVVNRQRRRAPVPLPALQEAVALPLLATVREAARPRPRELERLAKRLLALARPAPASEPVRRRFWRRAEGA
jgi:pilus assembly protein CpaE